MDLGDRIEEFSAERKIYYDGECFHQRLPIKLIKILRKFIKKVVSVHWEGVWKNDDWLYVVLCFRIKEIEKKSKIEKMTVKESDDGEYVVLRG